MEYQSLKKLKRMDLLEMLIAQVEENERLLEKMDQLHFQLERQKTLSPREAGTSGSAASALATGLGRSQGFAGSAGYAGSAGLMGSAGTAGSMLGGSAASAPSRGSVSSAGSLRSASGMQAQQSFAAGNQGSLSSAAPYAAGSSYQSASYASAAQSDPYAPAPQADPYDPTSQASSYAQTPPNSSASRLDPYAPKAHADSYAPAAQNASAVKGPQTSQPAPYRSAAQADPYAQTSQAAPYAAISRSELYASESPYYASAAQPAPYAAERESGRMGQSDRPREGLNHPDLLREELYGRQPLSFAEKDGPGVLPSFLQEMPREDQEDFSCSRVQPGREAPSARSASPYYKQNVVPLKPSQAGARTVNFAPASAAASFAAGAGTPAAARQSQVRPLPFAAESGYAATGEVRRSNA